MIPVLIRLHSPFIYFNSFNFRLAIVTWHNKIKHHKQGHSTQTSSIERRSMDQDLTHIPGKEYVAVKATYQPEMS